ncbi:MAG: hypothetical protein OES32_06440 [Acidobacteriota bacterium]|nr:hypothetical protein [Acidobacteriota bacterium]MDH3523207.1 hypothetical protein [Acidobacteriota bacterium]
MLRIDHLRLELPPGFEDRAAGLARLVGDELAALPLTRGLRLDRLQLEPIAIAPGATDRQIAGQIATGIQRRLESESGG